MRCSSDEELLETDVPWDDAIVVWAGKLRKLWDSLNELRSTLCERRLERTVLRPALLPVETAQFTQFFRQVWHHTVKLLSLTESVEGTLDMKWHRIAKDFEMSVLRIEVATWKFLCSYNTTFVWQYHGLRLVRKPKHRWENYNKWTLKWVLEKCCVRVITGFNWLAMEYNGVGVGTFVNTGSTRGETVLSSAETKFPALHFWEDWVRLEIDRLAS